MQAVRRSIFFPKMNPPERMTQAKEYRRGNQYLVSVAKVTTHFCCMAAYAWHLLTSHNLALTHLA
jgi:hypothetical protein